MLTITMFKPGDYVFVEDPTYFIAIKIFRDDLGLNVISGKLNFSDFILN
jgi:DNA-binding transcriptional MocR family regulator